MFQLGGHCDGNHDALAVAIKEAQEESGIMGIEPVSRAIFDIDIHLILKTRKKLRIITMIFVFCYRWLVMKT